MVEADVKGIFQLLFGLLEEAMNAADEDDPTRRKWKIKIVREKLRKAELARLQEEP